MSGNVRVLVVDEHLYVGNGLVSRWLKGIGYSMERNIIDAAPERTGELKAGITLDFTHESLRILSAIVSSTAPHTRFVIEGTANHGVGNIYSTRGFRNLGTIGRITEAQRLGLPIPGDIPTGLWMRLSDSRNGYHLVVSGQRPNNFMRAGYDRTARRHRALRPLGPVLLSG